jgi:hypothetical protein
MTTQEMKSLQDCLDQDEIECKKMHSTGAKVETISSATGKALAGGITLKAIIAAMISAIMTGGGVQGIIAAILALLSNPPATP